MVQQMGSQNPDSLVEANVLVAGEFDPCGLVLSGADSSSIFGTKCPDAMHLDRSDLLPSMYVHLCVVV